MFVVVEISYRENQQTMVFAGVASGYGCIEVPSGVVGREVLPFEGILQVYKLFLIKLEVCHFTNYLSSKLLNLC
ncbi:hypothetical protein SDC9_173754 [bioreactor metagenome]|uniref:Uncharacterized protein n=1 Tax=bioreactor metagenome TaxID=1076179 RepID=A0A645GJK5_9ZZZZ